MDTRRLCAAMEQLNRYYYIKLAYLLLVAFSAAGLLCRFDGVPFLAALYQAVSAVSAPSVR
jgi:hypothetical protein